MQNVYDYRKFSILYVDDEEKSLKYFAKAFSEEFTILTAPTAREGLKLLEANKDSIGLLITDQRMAGEKGVWLLEKARQLRPRIIRILVTAYADMDAAISAVNAGAIYKYVNKPWDPPDLESTLKRGLEFFIVERERDQLLKEKMSVLHNMMIADRIVSLGLLAAGMSHHIRNSLVAVKTFLDLAPLKLKEENLNMDALRNPDFWKEYYLKVQAQIDQITNMLKDLWAASEKPAFEFGDRIRLRELIDQVAAGLQGEMARCGIKLINNVPDSLPPMVVDKIKFSRLFELLLKDEFVSLPSGSEVTFSAALGGRNNEVVIEVRDNGPGLPKEALRLIFDPFVARSESPLEYGINLMACYFIVHHHGGRIEAQSEPGKGTVFHIHLPLNPNQPPLVEENQGFLQKVLLNDTMWEELHTDKDL